MRARTLVALLAVAVLIACDKSSPTAPPPPPPPPPPVVRVLTGLRVEGPDTVAPGETAKFAALAEFNTGAAEDYSTKVQWSFYSQTASLRSDGGGQITGVANGDASVRAGVERFAATKDVVVTPTGTVRMSGSVKEGNFPVPGARIAVLRGIGTGLQGLTDDAGFFKLYGVNGDIRLEIFKPGFERFDRVVTVPSAGTVPFELKASEPRLGMTGTYEMTIEANGICTAFPFEVRRRQYTASVVQNGPELRVQLSGATFEVRDGRGDGFNGAVQPGTASLFISDGSYTSDGKAAPWPDLLEKMPDGRFFGAGGIAMLTPRGADFAGTLRGQLYLMSSPGSYLFYAPILGMCPSANPGFPIDHAVTLRRQAASSAR